MKKILSSILFITCLAALPRIFFLFHHDIWFDEAFSFFIAEQNIPDLLTATAADNNPPLYYLVLHWWMVIFGYNEIALRSLSLLFGIMAILVIYLLTNKLFNKTVASYSSYLFGFSPLLIYFSAEARMYSLFVFLTLLSTFFWINFLKRQFPLTGLLFLLSFTLSLYTHYYAYLLFLPFIILLFQIGSQSRTVLVRDKKKLGSLIILIIPFLLTVPWILQFLKYPHPEIFSQSTIIALPATFASFTLGGTGVVTLRMFFSELSPLWAKILFFIAAALPILLGLKGTIIAKKTIHGRILLCLLFLPLLILTISSLLLPIYSVRSTIFLAPYFFILVGLGIQSLPQARKLSILLTLCILFTLVLITTFMYPTFRGLAIKETIKEIPLTIPLLHTSVLTYYPFEYYQMNKQDNHLLTHNPLSRETTEIIGGSLENQDVLYKEFMLIETLHGTNAQELEKLDSIIEKKYILVSTKNVKTIKVSHFQRRSL